MTTTNSDLESPVEPLWKRRGFRRLVMVAAIPALALAWWLGSPLFLDRTVDEAFPISAAAEPAAPATTPQIDDNTAPAPPDAGEGSEPPAVEPPLGQPAELAMGSFQGFDSVHQGSGTAAFYDVDGATLLRFEDFEVTNGPDLRVNLVLSDGSHVDLGELKGNIGDQNYDVPGDVDLADVQSVLIYCRAFSVEFAEAPLI